MAATTTDTRCFTGRLIAGLPEAVQVTLNKALAAPHVSTTNLLEVLGKHGIRPERAENVNRHRRRLQGGNYTCKCPLPTEATS